MSIQNIDDITLEDIQILKDNQVPEGKNIEYKRQLPGNNDRDKIRFLATISSFANTSGGDIYYGIEEREGKPFSTNGFHSRNIDQDTLRLEQIIRNGIEPSIPDLQIHTIPVDDDNFITTIRVNKSWSSPHRVTLNNHAKFYGRNSAGKYPLDVNELRTAFLLTENIANRIRNFLSDRIAGIYGNKTPFPLHDGAKLMVHLVPLSSFSNPDVLTIEECRTQQNNLRPIGGSGWNSKINIDGIFNYSGANNESCESYAQIYRNGVIETTCTIEAWDGQLLIPSTWVEERIIKTLSNYLLICKNLRIEVPIYVFVNFIGVKKYKFAVNNRLRQGHQPVDRDLLQFQELTVESYDVEPHLILRQLFDQIWNAWGYDKSYNYTDEGQWVSR